MYDWCTISEKKGKSRVTSVQNIRIFVFFILTVAAAESAIGLAILVVMFRNRDTINVDELDSMKW